MWLYDWPTKVKLLNRISVFCHFRPKWDKYLALMSLKCGTSQAIIAIHLHSASFATTTFCFKTCDSQSKIWKKPNDISCFFTFFTTLDIIRPKFYPKTKPDLIFFAGFQWSMSGNLVNTKNFNWNLVGSSEKKLLKPLKCTIFWPNLCKNGFSMGHAQNKKLFF